MIYWCQNPLILTLTHWYFKHLINSQMWLSITCRIKCSNSSHLTCLWLVTYLPLSLLWIIDIIILYFVMTGAFLGTWLLVKCYYQTKWRLNVQINHTDWFVTKLPLSFLWIIDVKIPLYCHDTCIWLVANVVIKLQVELKIAICITYNFFCKFCKFATRKGI